MTDSNVINLTRPAYDNGRDDTSTAGYNLQLTRGFGTRDRRLDRPRNLASGLIQLLNDRASGTGVTETEISCYCRGTLILTEHAEVPIEALEVGDRVVTVSGEMKPIRWIGRRGDAGGGSTANSDGPPVIVSADALADGVPTRDLWISPDHALYLDKLLVPARHLTNGITIVQARAAEAVGYYAVELHGHDVIFAQGAPAESYTDRGNRAMFDNADEYATLYPDASPGSGPTCARRLDKKAAAAIRERLFARAVGLGHRTIDDPAVHLIVDGVAVPPLANEGEVYRFDLDRPASAVWLASRSAVPAETDTSSTDRRRLGVPVRKITLRNADLTLDLAAEHPLLRDGFHAREGEHRWTTGMARLPESMLELFTGAFEIEIAVWPSDVHYVETGANRRPDGSRDAPSTVRQLRE